jgi:hypothetical protein
MWASQEEIIINNRKTECISTNKLMLSCVKETCKTISLVFINSIEIQTSLSCKANCFGAGQEIRTHCIETECSLPFSQ